MQLEHEPLEAVKKEILDVVGAHLPLDRHRVFFFGSRVTGKSTEHSDIDIGIEGPPIPTEQWLSIQDEIENLPILYKVEIADFNHVSPIFRKVALEKIEYILPDAHDKT